MKNICYLNIPFLFSVISIFVISSYSTSFAFAWDKKNCETIVQEIVVSPTYEKYLCVLQQRRSFHYNFYDDLA